MSIEKATEFLKELSRDNALQEKFEGFTIAELKAAVEEMRKSSDRALHSIAEEAGKFDI